MFRWRYTAYYYNYICIPTLGVPPMVGKGDVKQNPGPQKKQQLSGLVWHDHSTKYLFAVPMIQTYFTPGDLWSNPEAVADLLKL